MDMSKLSKFRTISVVLESRPDGGLRVYSDDVPGFFLSHSDREAVLSDVEPALETIIGYIVGGQVKVTQRSLPPRHLSWEEPAPREAWEYEARAAA